MSVTGEKARMAEKTSFAVENVQLRAEINKKVDRSLLPKEKRSSKAGRDGLHSACDWITITLDSIAAATEVSA